MISSLKGLKTIIISLIDIFIICQATIPEPQVNEVRIQVKAAGLSYVDNKVIRGRSRISPEWLEPTPKGGRLNLFNFQELLHENWKIVVGRG